MRLAVLFAGLLLSLFATVTPAQEIAINAAPPANPNANAATRAVLSYLYSLPGRSENRLISGQFGSYGDGTSYDTAQTQLNRVNTLGGGVPRADRDGLRHA